MGSAVAYMTAEDGRVLRGVLLGSPADRPLDTRDNWLVKVGVGRAGRVDAVGEWDGASLALKAHVPLVLGGGSLARALPSGSCVVVETVRRGSPSPLIGSSVLLRVGHGLTNPGQAVQGRDVRDAFEAAADLATQARYGEVAVPFALGLEPVERFTGISHTASAQTITAGGAYEDGSVSVTAKRPAWATIGWASVTVDVSVLGITATGNLFAAIGNSVAELTGEQYASSLTTQRDAISLTYRGTIDKTTTFLPRFKSDTNNASLIRQTISVEVDWRA